MGSRREILQDGGALNLVACDATHGGVWSASRTRGPQPAPAGQLVGELYEIYILDRAKRYGLGRELFETVTDWCRSRHMATMIVWVLENNQHARRFYEAMGGQLSGRAHSTVRGFGVVEVSYLYRL